MTAPTISLPIGDTVCQQCGGRNPVWFADNDLWNDVAGNREDILCPTCFIVKADRIVRVCLPHAEVSGLADEARRDAKAFRENTVYNSEGDPVRLIAVADRLDTYATHITTLEAAEKVAREREAETIARYDARLDALEARNAELMAEVERLRATFDRLPDALREETRFPSGQPRMSLETAKQAVDRALIEGTKP
jgi:cell division protein FtsB